MEGTRLLVISCPSSPQVHWTTRWIQDLGPHFLSSIQRRRWMPVVDILAAWSAFFSLGGFCHIHETILRSIPTGSCALEFCQMWPVSWSHPWKILLTSFGALIVHLSVAGTPPACSRAEPLCFESRLCWRHLQPPFSLLLSQSPGASQGLPLWSQQTLFKYVSLENGHSPFSYISFLKEEGEQNIFLWIHLGDQDPFQEAAPKFSCLHAGFLQTLPGRRVRIFFFSMCPPSKCEGFILGGVANMTPLKKQNPNRPRFGMLEWPREPRDELTQARSDYPLTSPCQAFCWLPASNTFVTDVRTLGLLHSHIQQMEIVVVVEPSNDIPLPFRTEFSSAQGPPPQPPWQSSSPGQVVTVSTSWHSFWSQAPFTYLPATLRGLITHAPSRSSLNTWVFCVQGWELECWLSFCGQSQSYKEGWKGRNYEVAFANCCSQFLLFQAVMRFPIRQLT